MAPIPASSIGATVIQGSFSVGGPRIPVVAGPVPPVQPRMAGPQPIQTPLPHPNAAQRQIAPGAIAQAAPAHPRATPPLAHHQRMAQPIVPQPRGVHLQAVLPRTATPQGPVVQRVGNGEAFQLPANLSNFGGAGGQPLPDPVRQKMESFFNTSFADVRVHVGPQASSIGALAFTHGSNLYFAPGQYNPNTAQGQHLLGHELTHVLQQRAGRVRNPFGSGMAVVQDSCMEHEADRMGLRAACHQVTVQAKPASPARVAPPAARPPSPPMMPPRTTAPQGAVQRAAPVSVSGMMAVGNGSYKIVAGAGGQKVGSVMVHNRGTSTIEVTDLAVDPSHRKRGLGGVLMESAMRAGLQLGKTKVKLASQDSGTGRLTSWYKNMGFVPVGSNSRGYPVLEAPITRALPRVVQGCIFPAPSSAGTLSTAGTRQPAAVLQRAEGMTDERAFDLARAKFKPTEYDKIDWPKLASDPLLKAYIQKRSGGLSQFKKDLKGASTEYKQIAKATADAKEKEATAKQDAANKLARIAELKTGYGSPAAWNELVGLGEQPRVERHHDGGEAKERAKNAHVACYDVWWTEQDDPTKKWCLHIHFSKANETAANVESAHFKKSKNHQAGNNAADFGESAACALVGIT
jgi:ribosomal protein S18 acetylase RimI-like enzyme